MVIKFFFKIEKNIIESIFNLGIQGAFDGHGAKTVIPRKVIGKFSIRVVPDQDPVKIEKQVVEYLEKKFKERNSPNKAK